MYEQRVFANLQTMLRSDPRSPLQWQDSIAIYGAGGRGIELYIALRKNRPDLQVLFFIDTYASGKVEKLNIYSIDYLPVTSTNDLKIVVASTYWPEICLKLREKFYNNYIVYDPYFSYTNNENCDSNNIENKLYRTHEIVKLLERREMNEFVSHEYVVNFLCNRFYNISERRMILLERTLRQRPEILINVLLVAKKSDIDIDDLCAAIIHHTCNPTKKTIALFYNCDMFAQIGDEILSQFYSKGYNCLFFSMSHSYDALDFLLPIDKEIFVRLDMLSLAIGYKLPLWIVQGKDWISKIKTMDIDRTARHEFSEKNNNIALFTRVQYIIMPVASSGDIVENKKQLYVPGEIKLPKEIIGQCRERYILPLIPNKYERIRSKMAFLKSEEKRYILVCPSLSDLPEYFTKIHGMTIIGKLLERYSDHKTVFRPRPADRQCPEVKSILSSFSDHPRFIFDDLDDYAEMYAHGTVLITDRSSTGQTFTLATFQPSIYTFNGHK